MSLDDELDIIEESGETDAEQVDEETEIQDAEDVNDELLDEIPGSDALERDQTKAYDSVMTDNEADYDGYDPFEVEEDEAVETEADVLNSEGYHEESVHDIEEEVLEMEIEEGDIHAYLVDEDDNEIGFVLIDDEGNEQEYYYVDMDEYEIVDEEGDEGTRVVRASNEEEFDLGITREGIAEATADLNAIYKDGAEVAAELRDNVADIYEGLSFLKKRR